MTYFIFLKSLRSLEEFRNNPHVQIPSRSPCKISQSHSKFQIHLKFKNKFPFEFSPGSGPAGPTHPTLAHLTSQPIGSPLGTTDLKGLGAFAKRRYPFWLAYSTVAPFLFPGH
jgi:hypothetical protein